MEDSDDGVCFSRASLLKALENYDAFEIGWSLKEIDFEDEKLGDDRVTSLALSLNHCKFVKIVDLSGNNISNDSAADLGNMLRSNRIITSLSLRSNNIGDPGAVSLAQGLEANRHLELLHLDKNEIGDVGAKALAKALSVNSTLQRLDLFYNYIGEAGGEDILTALWNNTTLMFLDLGMNELIAKSQLTHISSKLEKNRAASINAKSDIGHHPNHLVKELNDIVVTLEMPNKKSTKSTKHRKVPSNSDPGSLSNSTTQPSSTTVSPINSSGGLSVSPSRSLPIRPNRKLSNVLPDASSNTNLNDSGVTTNSTSTSNNSTTIPSLPSLPILPSLGTSLISDVGAENDSDAISTTQSTTTTPNTLAQSQNIDINFCLQRLVEFIQSSGAGGTKISTSDSAINIKASSEVNVSSSGGVPSPSDPSDHSSILIHRSLADVFSSTPANHRREERRRSRKGSSSSQSGHSGEHRVSSLSPPSGGKNRGSSKKSSSRKHKSVGEILQDLQLSAYEEQFKQLGVIEIEDIKLLEDADWAKLKLKPVHQKKLVKLAFKTHHTDPMHSWTDTTAIEAMGTNELVALLKKHQMAVSVIQQELSARKEMADECVICLESKRTHCVVPCGHKMFCEGCVGLLHECPICRIKVKSSLKVFG